MSMNITKREESQCNQCSIRFLCSKRLAENSTESPAEINRKKCRLIEAIVTSQTFRNYNVICQDDAEEETIDAEKVFKRRERFIKKILLQTSLCGLPVAFAEEVCYTLLCAVDMVVLKNVRWVSKE